MDNKVMLLIRSLSGNDAKCHVQLDNDNNKIALDSTFEMLKNEDTFFISYMLVFPYAAWPGSCERKRKCIIPRMLIVTLQYHKLLQCTG